MLKLFSSLSSALTIIGIVFLITCKLPTDPAVDPNRVKGSILLVEPTTGIIEREKAAFGIAINYPVHVDSITVSFGDAAIGDTTIYCATSSTTPETLIVHCVYTNEGLKTVKAKIALTNQSYKDLEETFRVSLKKATVSFEPTEPSRLVPTNEPVILYFQAATVPAGHAIDFTVTSVPPLDANHLGIVDEGSRAKVTVTCPEAIQHKIICYATTGTDASDTTETTLIPYIKPTYTNTSGNATSTVGTTDTLLFVLPKDSSVYQFTLLDSSSYTPGIIKILPTTSDTVKFIFTPDETKIYTFSFLVTKDNLTDTVTFQRVVSGPQEPIWKQHSSTIAASEGKVVSHSFGPYLTDTTLANSSFTASKGTMAGKTLNFTAPWGSTKDSITISANYNGTVSSYTLLLSITSGDSSKPVISPEKTSDTTNAAKVTCKFSITDAGAGIGKVSFRVTNATVLSQTNTDSLFQCVIDSLKHGTPAILTVVASDSSIRTNSDSLTITIIRDTTLADNDGPIITYISGPKSGERVTSDTATIRLSVEDGSGVSGVTATLNGTTITGLTKDGSVYSIPLRLTAYSAHRILISATDKAATPNSENMSIDLDYNTKPSAITPVTPRNDSTGVALLPAFTWSGGDDTDKDTVFYKVLFGTTTTLNSQSAAVTTKNVTLTTPLTANTKYYWQVIGYTTKYRDTVRSAVVNFTTLNDDNSGPVITFKSGTANESRVKVASGSLVVTATDPNGVDSVSATLGGTIITGITSSGSDYTIPYTLTQFGTNSIVISATDNSPGRNKNSLTINYTYNTSPSALSLVSPADEAQEIDTLPTFAWEGGVDADGDSVFFRVLYGASESSLTSQSSEYFKVSSIKLTTKLATNTIYYWKVIGYTKGTLIDTVTLGTYSFRTVNPDRTTPSITITSPASYTSGMRVTTASGTVTFNATDANGIDSVYYKINNGTRTVLTGSGPQYSFNYTLSTFGPNTIRIYAVDKSTEKNRDSSILAFTYNTTPSAVTLQIPVDEATGVDTLPTFKWTGGDDIDNNVVSYRVLYGTLATSLSSQSSVVTVDSVKLTSKLATNRTYYWKVIAFTDGTYKDTISSPTYSFTTANPDRTVPTLAITIPASYTAGMRVTTSSGTIAFTASDNSGIDSAYYTINSGTKTMVSGTNGSYSFQYSLTRRGLDTITVSVVDGSNLHNKSSSVIIVNYNAPIATSISVSAPTASATNVALRPTFTWTALTDGDGDAVSYVVAYGLESDLSDQSFTSEVATATITLPAANALTSNTRYYYRVIGYTKTPYQDTARSSIRSFTIIPVQPTITTQPSNRSLVLGSTATFTVVASGTGLSYQWQRGITNIEDATSASYTTAATNASDNGVQFRCVVTNAGGSVTSSAATLNIQYSVTYNANWGSVIGTGNVPTDPTLYTSNATGIVLGNTNTTQLNSSTHSFGGWRTSPSGTETPYNAGDELIIEASNVTLYAVWSAIPKFKVIYHGNGNTNGTAPIDPAEYASGQLATIKNEGDLKKIGYVFDGWMRVQNGSVTEYREDVYVPVSAELNLYARWIIKDANGNTYTEVRIGDQVWMVEDFRCTSYRDGSVIPYVNNVPSSEKIKYNRFDETYYYTGWALTDSRNLAPEGWRIPTKDDWRQLINSGVSTITLFPVTDSEGDPSRWGASEIWSNDPTDYRIYNCIIDDVDTGELYVTDNDAEYFYMVRLIREY